MGEKKVWAYIGVAVVVALGAVLLPAQAWRTGMGAHTAMETVAAAVAAFVALVTLVRYYARRDRVLLFVGTAFAGTAVLDVNHALITSAFLSWRLPSPLESLGPWSWLAGRVFLPLFLLVGYLVWRNTGRGDHGHVRREWTVYAGALVFMVAVAGFFVLVPLPRGLFPAASLSRPQELLPGALFALALAVYLHKGRWRTDPFEHWLVLSLVLAVGVHLGFMVFARFLSNALFDAGHVLKILSYACVLVGSVASMYGLFRRAETSAEDALEANRRLRALDRAKTEFIGIASHELRSPLTSVAGFAEMLDRRWQDLEEGQRREMAERIHGQSSRLVRLTDDLLAMSRLDAEALEARREPVDVSEAARRVTEELEGRVGVEICVPDDLWAFADPGHVRQILVNYVTNAERYGDAPIRVEGAGEGGHVEVVVADSGGGVPEEFVPRLFERFARADSTEKEGTGLGLAIVQGLARVNGGEVFYEPNVPKGSRFGVRLPVVGAQE